jgi:ATP-dependent Clp protease ATP-binding subunit ClpA
MFTTTSRRFGLGRVYFGANAEARRRGDRRIGTEHLLLALIDDPHSAPAQALGVPLSKARDTLQALDDIALASLGITAKDLGREVIPGSDRDRLGLTPAARAVFSGLRKQAGGEKLVAMHILRSLLELHRPDPAAELMDALGVDRAAVRERTRSAADGAA